MQQLYLNFTRSMGEGAKMPIVTFLYIMRIKRAKFPLVALWVIKLLDLIVAEGAIIAAGAILIFGGDGTGLSTVFILARGSSAVFIVVIVGAKFRVMIAFYGALLGFKGVQVKFLLLVAVGCFCLFGLVTFIKNFSGGLV